MGLFFESQMQGLFSLWACGKILQVASEAHSEMDA
jgi:hypothetical protein